MRSLAIIVTLLSGCLSYDDPSNDDAALVRHALDGAVDDLSDLGATDAAMRPDGGLPDAAFASSIRFVEYSKTNGSGTSLTLAAPMGTMPGDQVLIAVRIGRGDDLATQSPSGQLMSMSSNDYSMSWCLHTATSGSETYTFTLAQSTAYSAYAATFTSATSSAITTTGDYAEGDTVSLATPAGSVVVAMLGYADLETNVPNFMPPAGFGMLPPFDGIFFFDGGIDSPAPPSFSFAGYDRGDMLTAFVTLSP